MSRRESKRSDIKWWSISWKVSFFFNIISEIKCKLSSQNRKLDDLQYHFSPRCNTWFANWPPKNCAKLTMRSSKRQTRLYGRRSNLTALKIWNKKNKHFESTVRKSTKPTGFFIWAKWNLFTLCVIVKNNIKINSLIYL